jgi:hypothetical protein
MSVEKRLYLSESKPGASGEIYLDEAIKFASRRNPEVGFWGGINAIPGDHLILKKENGQPLGTYSAWFMDSKCCLKFVIPKADMENAMNGSTNYIRIEITGNHVANILVECSESLPDEPT